MTIAVGGWVLALVCACVTALACSSLARRRKLVTRACHELRGPLTAARLGIEFGVTAGALPPERLRAIDLELGRAGLALEDLDRAGATAPFSAGHVSVVDLLADSVAAWELAARAHGCSIELDWRGGPALVLGDRLRLAQATGNLIANAIEHGGGRITVNGSCRSGWVRIEVRDEGPGLRAPIERLTRPRRGGRGLGIGITRDVVEVHGGRLAAEPSDRGARLVIELPAALREEKSTAPAG